MAEGVLGSRLDVDAPMKILSIVGARPQFVKAAVLSRRLRHARGVQEVLVHTGQHYDDNMSRVFFEELKIPEPSVNLGIGSGSHGAQTGRMLEALERTMIAHRPDCVLVYGDTNSTLAGALAAAKLRIPVGHVEAGLRSFNMEMPEEINRIVADRVSRWLFCPTEKAVENLRTEGTAESRLSRPGDVMYDAALFYSAIAKPGRLVQGLLTELKGGFCVATVHRAKNTDNVERLRGIVTALEEIATDIPVVVPLHPRTRARLEAFGIRCSRVQVIEPVSYFDMICLMRACKAVLTDSGGLQKEAFFFGRPCVTLREETEWTELVSLGVNILGGSQKETICAAWHRLRHAPGDFNARPYGNGTAGEEIVSLLVNWWEAGRTGRTSTCGA